MNAAALTALRLGPRWRQLDEHAHHLWLRFDDPAGTAAEFGVRRCMSGPLRDTYPVSAHDVEIYAADSVAPQTLSRALTELNRAVLDADPCCRRVVFAAPTDHAAVAEAIVAAGFRHVVDVDVPGAELSLFVAEPSWVSKVDSDLHKVPGS